jgi:VIT1/CCC1 family predicted Fe2+/Mn2+ transporter
MNSHLLDLQRDEITELTIYQKIIPLIKNVDNRKVLERFAKQEKGHYDFLKTITKRDTGPLMVKVWWYLIITRIFGLSFGLKLLERDETHIVEIYDDLKSEYPQISRIIADEKEHEQELLNLINSKALEYASSVILGLNDALIELTGALIGFTLALAATHTVAVVGLITGIAASLSMASASYLSSKESDHASPIAAGLVTGCSYIVTTLLLIFPYFLTSNPYIALFSTIGMVVTIIAFFNFYTAVTKNMSFKKRFAEMFLISLVVGAINFGVGILIKKYFVL